MNEIMKIDSIQTYNDYFGVEIVTKGTRFTQKLLGELDFLNITTDKWTGDEHRDELIERAINNYMIDALAEA